jgi:hypothetical protein
MSKSKFQFVSSVAFQSETYPGNSSLQTLPRFFIFSFAPENQPEPVILQNAAFSCDERLLPQGQNARNYVVEFLKSPINIFAVIQHVWWPLCLSSAYTLKELTN